MAKGTKLPEFEKGEITALKRVGNSQRKISKGAVKRLSAISWKVQTNMEQENQLPSLKNSHNNSREEWFSK